jgi:adenosylcobinamide hydrolase
VPTKTLVITFPHLLKVLRSREGFKEVRAACNNFNPPPLWDLIHQDWELYLAKVLADLKLSPAEVAILSTGVDMDHCVVKVDAYQELRVSAFVTAGVESNAMRIGVDKAGGMERNGKFERFGTINTILLTNARLSEGAMVRAIITATEAKTIALQDMDIRSSYNPETQATGTGTDNIIIVSGEGPEISYCGGHCKMGELMAGVVASATGEAITKHRSGTKKEKEE